MKKFMRYCSAVICFGAALLFSSTCFAQTTYPFIAVGSSAAFNAFAIAGASNGAAPICVNSYTGNLSSASNVYYWTQSSSAHSLQAVDGRSTDFAAQNAKAWVEWSGSADGATLNAVCVYLATDSIVGQRLYFATNSAGTPASSINFPGGCASTYPIGGQYCPQPSAPRFRARCGTQRLPTFALRMPHLALHAHAPLTPRLERDSATAASFLAPPPFTAV
jgi:hypothetical protein